jgi:hypothetical protein
LRRDSWLNCHIVIYYLENHIPSRKISSKPIEAAKPLPQLILTVSASKVFGVDSLDHRRCRQECRVFTGGKVEQCVLLVVGQGAELESDVIVLGCVLHFCGKKLGCLLEKAFFDVICGGKSHCDRVKESIHDADYDETIHICDRGRKRNRVKPHNGRGNR